MYIVAIIGICLLYSVRGNVYERPKDLEGYYKVWKPLELVRGLRSLSVDPLDVFRSLEAIKDLDSEEALDAMHDLGIRPITIYDALDDLGVEPFDAYYALKSWLTDPLLHQPGDHYHRVNASGDPTHPYLHVLYKKSDTHSDEYKALFLTSKEVEDELKDIEKEYKEAESDDKYRMNDFINEAKEIHSAFEDPAKVFEDFFGKRHFEEWRNMFPEAFKSLKDIYKNPLGFGLRKGRKELNNSTKPEKVYHHVHKGREYSKKQQAKGENEDISEENDAFSQFNDPSRYDTLMDETHTENDHPVEGGKDINSKVHHTKLFYDKVTNMYIECKETRECLQTSTGTRQRVYSKVKQFDPKTYETYRQQKDKEQQEKYHLHQQHPLQHPHHQPPPQQPPPQQPPPQQPPPQQPPHQQPPSQQPPPQQHPPQQTPSQHPPPQQPCPEREQQATQQQPQHPPKEEPQEPPKVQQNQPPPQQQEHPYWQQPYPYYQQQHPQPYYHQQQPYYPQQGQPPYQQQSPPHPQYPYPYQQPYYQQHYQQPQPQDQQQQPEQDTNRAAEKEHGQFHAQ